jgi:hypothetical protein
MNPPSPFPEKRGLSSIGQSERNLYADLEHLKDLGLSLEVSTSLVLNHQVTSLRSMIEILRFAVGSDLAVEMISVNSKDLTDLFEADVSRFNLFAQFLSELRELIPTLITSGDFSITDFTSIDRLASIRHKVSAHLRTSSSQQGDS